MSGGGRGILSGVSWRWLVWIQALTWAAGCGDDGAGAGDGGALDAGAVVDAALPGRDAGTCPPPLGEPALRTTAPAAHPMDDVLRVNQLQAEGTHNSYHVRPEPYHPDWDYTMAPLDVQLDEQGVRKLELDTWWNERCGRWEVYHIGFLDELTTCRQFTDCLETVRGWSDAHPSHHPIFIQIEVKTPYDDAEAPAQLDALDAEILSVFPEDLIITPDSVRGSHDTLADAIATDGWPTLGESRGKVLFFMNNRGPMRDVYTHGGSDLDGRAIFAESDPGEPFAAVRILNGAVDDFDAIQSSVRAGYIVRTRGPDAELWASALDSGAQLISTDNPAPVDGESFYAEIPGGTPSRCNPLVAPDGCTSEAIEDPSLL